MKLRIPYPRVTVFWRDIVGESGWSAPDELGKTADCITRGWLIGQDEHNYYVASTIGLTAGETLEVCDRNTIPRGVVSKIQMDSMRGCKNAASSSNTGKGPPAHRENVGANPTDAASPRTGKENLQVDGHKTT